MKQTIKHEKSNTLRAPLRSPHFVRNFSYPQIRKRYMKITAAKKRGLYYEKNLDPKIRG
jgi:hypothetical protein